MTDLNALNIAFVIVGHQVHAVIELVAGGGYGAGVVDDRLAQPAFGVIGHCAAGVLVQAVGGVVAVDSIMDLMS